MPKYAIRSILLLGPPGSGKGTVGDFLSRIIEIPHLSTGSLVRNAPSSSPLGQARAHLSDSGSLLSDELIFSAFQDHLKSLFRLDEKGWILLDGIPRTSEQVDLISDMVHISIILHLQVPSNILLERLAKRARSQKRADDLESSVTKKRIEIYEQNLNQILAKFDSSRVLKIQAEKHPFLVLADALSVLVPFLDA